MELRDKVVLVTGSSEGIGRETAVQFAQKKSKVIITFNTEKEEGMKVLEECKKYSDSILLHLDVRNDESIKKVVKEVIDKYGRIDILVNNAGVILWKKFLDQDFQDIDEQIDVNLKGLIKVTRELLPHLQKQKEGIIINISSGAGKQGFSELTTYCGTKFGVRGFTQALAQELSHGIRIYCINPGMTATKMTDYTGTDPQKVAGIIIKTAEEKLNKKPGEDIDVWEYIA